MKFLNSNDIEYWPTQGLGMSNAIFLVFPTFLQLLVITIGFKYYYQFAVVFLFHIYIFRK